MRIKDELISHLQIPLHRQFCWINSERWQRSNTPLCRTGEGRHPLVQLTSSCTVGPDLRRGDNKSKLLSAPADVLVQLDFHTARSEIPIPASCSSALLTGLVEADRGPFLDCRAQIPGVARKEDRDAVMILGAGGEVLVAEAFELGAVIGFEPA